METLLKLGEFTLKLFMLWAGAKTPEEKEAVRVGAQKAVDALDGHFSEVDAKDKALMDQLQADLDADKNP